MTTHSPNLAPESDVVKHCDGERRDALAAAHGQRGRGARRLCSGGTMGTVLAVFESTSTLYLIRAEHSPKALELHNDVMRILAAESRRMSEDRGIHLIRGWIKGATTSNCPMKLMRFTAHPETASV